ncbi:helix-turn-helix domain-containing protein [Thalassolituus alkanivorans]|nr:helix-turn-helix domain-containing protein [Thalassolituus alkanivorans]MCB2424263.1 helix-turn-helix domain-containing protein [Thalassolituus alkanivorans]
MTDRELLLAIGRNVRRQRLLLDITQEELSARSGLHPTYISEVERGKRNLTVVSLFRLAGALETEPSRILELVNSSPVIADDQ